MGKNKTAGRKVKRPREARGRPRSPARPWWAEPNRYLAFVLDGGRPRGGAGATRRG
jgi:hypothetical protein